MVPINLYSDSDLDTQFQLHFDGTVTASTLTGLPPIHFWIQDVIKHYSARKYMIKILNIFKITMKYHFWRNIPLLLEMDNKYMHIK